MRRFTLLRPTVAVLVLGLLVTAALALGAEISYNHDQRHLGSLETKLSASALGAKPAVYQHELGEVAGVAANSHEPIATFRRLIAPLMKPAGTFAAAALLQLKAGTPALLLHLGTASPRSPTGPVPTSLYRKAAQTGELVTSRVVADGQQRLGYLVAYTGSQGTFIVGGSQSLPTKDLISIPPNSPDAGLDVAIYFGSRAIPSALIASSTRQLPLRGAVSKAVVGFGTGSLTLVATPRTALAGTLAAVLPWAAGAVGLALTLLLALLVERVARRRAHAEELARQNELLYREQRAVSHTLQRALLPRAFPNVAGVDFAAVYEPGTLHTEVGGDWYSVVKADEHRFYFVVGDVSGHGVDCAALMAQVRFTIRALARLGLDPAEILELTSADLEVGAGGHFATVLVGVIEDRQKVTLASAGHFAPLLLGGEQAEFAAVKVGLPLGIAPSSYTAISTTLSPGQTLIAFTDGLVETRFDIIDAGLDRLRRAAVAHRDSSVEELVSSIKDELIPMGSEDDVALLVIRALPAANDDELRNGDLTGAGALGA